jgi:hypothetical protein
MINRYLVSLPCLVFFFASTSLAQIPNPSFEEWSGGLPVGWFGINKPAAEQVTQTSDAAVGISAVHVKVVEEFGSSDPLLPAAIVVGRGFDSAGYPFNGRPTALKGRYKFSQAGKDTLALVISLTRETELIGVGRLDIGISTPAYTEFEIPIEYSNTALPDTAVIVGFAGTVVGTSQMQMYVGTLGTSFQLDDLSFVFGAEVDEASQIITTLYPNPANESAHLNFTLDETSDVSVEIFNAVGQRVYRVTDLNRGPGLNAIALDTRSLPIGAYRYRLVAGTAVSSGLVQVVH